MNWLSRCGVSLLALALLGGCANRIRDDMGSWVGHPAKEMEAHLGHVSSKTSLGADRWRWTWGGYVKMPHGYAWRCQLIADVDRMGIVYRTSHGDCPHDTVPPRIVYEKAGYWPG